jgi:hypothetical protein
MGNAASNRWPKNYRRKMPVESCRRINAREAAHVDCETVQTSIGGTAARRLWCRCSGCAARVRFLYERPDRAGIWGCRRCHRLSYARQQQRGTRQAFEAWLTPARWQRMSAKHPATDRLYDRMAALERELCAAFDWDKLNAQQRAQLLQDFTGESVVRRIFDQRRATWSAQVEPMAEAVGDEIQADIWEWWKSKNRSKPKPKPRRPPERSHAETQAATTIF